MLWALLESIFFEVREEPLRLEALRLAVLRRIVVQVEVQLDDLQCSVL